MANTLRIVPPATVCFFTTLGILLNWGVIPTISNADIALQGSHPVVFSPIDPTLQDDRDLSRDISRDLLGSVGWSGYEAEGDHARSAGNWSEAEQSYVKAVELLDRATVQGIDQDLASLLNKLGVVRFWHKDFAGAEKSHRRALAIYSKARGADDLRVADTLDLVAIALFGQQYGQELAGSLFFRAWAIREKVLGQNHPDVADSLHYLALSLYSDNVSFAIPLLLRSMEIREKVFGDDHPSVADSLHAMARLYEVNNRRDLAIPLYQEALIIQERVFGPNAVETKQVRNNLNTAHQELGHSLEILTHRSDQKWGDYKSKGALLK